MHCLQIIKYLNGTPKYKRRVEALVSLQKIKERNRGKNGRKDN
jgi:hypothetical protein